MGCRGDLNVDPIEVPCLLKGIMAGHWFDLQASWSIAAVLIPLLLASMCLVLMEGPDGTLFLGVLWLLLLCAGVGC